MINLWGSENRPFYDYYSRENDIADITETSDADALVGLYQLNLTVGNVGLPGAPVLQIRALVNAPTGSITGFAQITQTVAPPNGNILIDPISGYVVDLSEPPGSKIVHITGTYIFNFPPPAIGSILEQFQANLLLRSDGSGRGSFTYDGHTVNDVPVITASN